MLRRYRRLPAEEAVKDVLNPLIDDLQSATSTAGKQDSNEEKAFAKRLLPMAYAQLAYTYATLLTLNSTWTKEEKEGLKNRSVDASAKAWKAFNEAKVSWSSEQERKEVERWIYNARGYSRFRIAYFVERSEALKAQSPSTEEANRVFRKACEEALTDLRKANEILPNNYEVLQNEAMILDDEDYDPDGSQLAEAEALYERTTLFVPRDYYQYERLALIYWRQLRSNPPVTLQSALIAKGQKVVSLAKDNRFPERSGTAEILGAYFSAWTAGLETDISKKRESTRAAIDQAESAITIKPPQKLAHETADLMNKVIGELTGTDPQEKELKEKTLEVATKLRAL
jgi:hypothetical protein